VLWFLLSGLSLGAAAGISPGPLLALLVSQTLRHGFREGAKVAAAPLLSDAPVVLLCLLAIQRAEGLGSAAAWVSMLGGCFVAYLGYDCLRAPGVAASGGPEAPRSLAKAVTVNLLNPHVYLFWAAVGAPMLLQGIQRRDGSALAFVVGFYAGVVGSKLTVAGLVHRSRQALAGRGYLWTMRIMGILLLGIAAWMLMSGVRGAWGFAAARPRPPLDVRLPGGWETTLCQRPS
jgi:threonine/homoserine/homoserine lactone efflux protein